MDPITTQTPKYLLRLQKTFILQRANRIGNERKLLQIGFAVVKAGNRIRFVCIKRRLVQTRIN
jgi:hypothetical protein